jgi:hypothetical protein
MSPDDVASLPMRMTTAEVCDLARFSPATFHRKRKADPSWLPASAVQGGRQLIFDREAVIRALGLRGAPAQVVEWTVDPAAIESARRARTRKFSARRKNS